MTTKQLAHTPGPWAVFHDHPEVGTNVAYIRPEGSEPFWVVQEIAVIYLADEREADGRLIAAAPELLQLLEEANEALANGWSGCSCHTGTACLGHRIDALVRKARGVEAG